MPMSSVVVAQSSTAISTVPRSVRRNRRLRPSCLRPRPYPGAHDRRHQAEHHCREDDRQPERPQACGRVGPRHAHHHGQQAPRDHIVHGRARSSAIMPRGRAGDAPVRQDAGEHWERRHGERRADEQREHRERHLAGRHPRIEPERERHAEHERRERCWRRKSRSSRGPSSRDPRQVELEPDQEHVEDDAELRVQAEKGVTSASSCGQAGQPRRERTGRADPPITSPITAGWPIAEHSPTAWRSR